MIAQRGRSRAGRAAPAIAVVGVLVVIWEAGVRLSGTSPVVLPAPSRVLSSLWEARDLAIRHSIPTIQETLAGFAVSLLAAVSVAVVMDRIPAVRRGLYPLLVGSQTVPIIAIAPLLVIWFGFGLLPKVLVVVLVTFFPITVATLDGFASTDAAAVDLMRTFGASDGQVFRFVRVPSALPQLFTGMRISITYAVVGAVFGEYVGAFEGLGIWMHLSKNEFRTDLVFGAILITTLISICLFVAVTLLERAVIPWYAASRR